MNIYIPSSYSLWLQSTPPEGQVLLVGLLTKFAAIYGNAHYFEMYNEDIDAINHTAKQGSAVQETKKLKDLGIIEIIRGLEARLTIRLSQDYIGNIGRRNIYDHVIEYKLSNEGSVIWSYLLGRLANLDETQEIVEEEITSLSKIRSFDTTRVDRFPVGKKSLTHILAPIYNDIFIKRNQTKVEVRVETDPVKIAKRKEQKNKISKEWYAKRKAAKEIAKEEDRDESGLTKKQRDAKKANTEWYAKNKAEVLRKKREWYADVKKKPKEDGSI